MSYSPLRGSQKEFSPFACHVDLDETKASGLFWSTIPRTMVSLVSFLCKGIPLRWFLMAGCSPPPPRSDTGCPVFALGSGVDTGVLTTASCLEKGRTGAALFFEGRQPRGAECWDAFSLLGEPRPPPPGEGAADACIFGGCYSIRFRLSAYPLDREPGAWVRIVP